MKQANRGIEAPFHLSGFITRNEGKPRRNDVPMLPSSNMSMYELKEVKSCTELQTCVLFVAIARVR